MQARQIFPSMIGPTGEATRLLVVWSKNPDISLIRVMKEKKFRGTLAINPGLTWTIPDQSLANLV
ncbi:hypothetical protein SAMN06296036_105168 [Pseudobacteriovorax antillogorgiicola]|uniref:Uncharacterized protein n=1 Tax=Pseudobacteriovorax antillogorgiicola TaxID=1513793 RepID=A0A1Y6BN73_9BACT|nr:hypothetical protein EDD56_105156 [Pseudobacteriovorax antillogorgiicola]SMF12473.1 hypothetical protein SAMN06296036_105168 [Pseudobacteriovorax antillogorgiicola]